MDRGFTLIELLVVMSIVSSLASVILVSVNDARTDALNRKINIIVYDYIIATEAYRSEFGYYPKPSLTATNGLGYPYVLDANPNPNADAGLNNAFLEEMSFLHDLSFREEVRVYYQCGLPEGVPFNINLPCVDFAIFWILISNDAECGNNAYLEYDIVGPPPTTGCRYRTRVNL